MGLVHACCLPQPKWESLQNQGTEERTRGCLLSRAGGQVGTADEMKHCHGPCRAKPLCGDQQTINAGHASVIFFLQGRLQIQGLVKI